jgi:hypothetical protein
VVVVAHAQCQKARERFRGFPRRRKGAEDAEDAEDAEVVELGLAELETPSRLEPTVRASCLG